MVRGELDHDQVHFCFAGGYRVEFVGRTAELRPGDIGIFDMAERARFELWGGGPRRRSEHATLYLPRKAVSSLLTQPEADPMTVISRNTPYGRLLAGHIDAFLRQAPELSSSENEAAVRATAALVAGALGGSPARRP